MHTNTTLANGNVSPALHTPGAVRNTVSAICLVAVPLLLLASDAITPSFEHGIALIHAADAHPGAVWAVALLKLLTALALVPAAVAIVSHVRGRGFVVACCGGVFAILGAIGQAQDSAYQLFVVSLRGTGAAGGVVLTRLDGVAAVVELPLLIALAFGLVLLPIAAWRARLAPTWVLIIVVVAFIGHFLPPARPIGIAVDVLLVVGYGALSWRMYRPEAPAALDGRG